MTIYLQPAPLDGDAESLRAKDTGRKLAMVGQLGLYLKDRQTNTNHVLTWEELEKMLVKHRAPGAQGAA